MAALQSPADHVVNLMTNQQYYERNGIPPNSRKAKDMRNVRNNILPQFFAFQVQAEGPNADQLAWYQVRFPGEAYGGIMACITHWIHFAR